MWKISAMADGSRAAHNKAFLQMQIISVRMRSFFKTDTPARTVMLFHAGKSEN
jgi:hypothetical protein